MRLRYGLLWIVCAAFVAYLSFVPFWYQPLPFAKALARFAQIPYLNLGAGNRADWVANILMFMPLGWLAAAFFMPHPRHRLRLLSVAPALIVGVVWAVAVEFGQLYFPNRTVSINDIVAEVIGTLGGASLWIAFGAHGLDWWRTLLRGGRATADAALAAYVLAYVVLGLSPFDFVISADELAAKAASNLFGLWLAPVGCGRTPCSVKLLVEVLAVVPFGWWWAMRRPATTGGVATALVLGTALGVLFELAQFLLVSGTSQGASIVSRAVGLATGAWLHSMRGRLIAIDLVRWGRPLVLAATIPYLAAVAFVSGWFGGRPLGFEEGLARVEQIRWIPFFYQYFSTEQALIRSTLVHLCLYLPVGIAVWIWGRRRNATSGWLAAVLAAGIAFVAESSKLFIAGKHPDYTDVLLAIIGSWTAATLLRQASGLMSEPGAAKGEAPRGPGGVATRGGTPTASGNAHTHVRKAEVAPNSGGLTPSWAARAVATALLFIVGLSLARFPVWPVVLAAGLAAYAWVLARRPLAYLLIVPAALPLLDLAPFSGRFFWDEFDLLLVVTLAMRLLSRQAIRADTPKLPMFSLGLLALSLFASTLVALWPPVLTDANAFSSYLSPYNALRVAKGYLWAGLLLWLLWRDAAEGNDVELHLQRGLGLALLAAVAGVFWERLLFVGLADPGAWFRAAGFVSATHVGGAYLEALLVALTPFALALGVSARRARIGGFWFAAACLGAVAVLMTLSRAAAMAWLVGAVSFFVLWWLGSRQKEAWESGRRRHLHAAAATLAIAAAAVAMIQSTYLRDRLALAGGDLALRLAHWQGALEMMRGDPLHLAFGMGLGGFPREFYLAQPAQSRPAAYRLEADTKGDGPMHLALYGGQGMFVDQRVDAVPGRELRLGGQVRATPGGSTLAIGLCEKSFLSSVRCESARVPAGTTWQPLDVRLMLPKVPAGRVGLSAPVSLSLHNGNLGTRIDVAKLSLLDESAELLANGSFENGLDRWLMFSDVHLAWRALNTPLQVFFEQGVLGILAWLALGLSAIAASAIRTGTARSAAASAAAVAFILVACFDTLLDAPRLTLLAALVFWLVCSTGRMIEEDVRRAAPLPTEPTVS